VTPDAVSWWAVDLPSVALLGGSTALYLCGARRRAAQGRRWSRRTASFLVGVAVALVAVVGPVAAFSEHLLWVHMVQHLLLTVIAAGLIAYGVPVSTARLALPPGPRHTLARWSRTTRRARRRIGDPPPVVLATALHITMLWVWHTPAVYDAAVRSPAIHLLEHLAFVGSAVWFWSEVRATKYRTPRRQAFATLCLGAMIVSGGLLGALLTFSGRSVYEVYDGLGGLTALQDQELAGGLMWVPPGFVYASVAIRRFIGWLRAAERDLRRREDRELSLRR
jgi:putative membrane protein